MMNKLKESTERVKRMEADELNINDYKWIIKHYESMIKRYQHIITGIEAVIEDSKEQMKGLEDEN